MCCVTQLFHNAAPKQATEIYYQITVLLLPALLERCCAQVDCEERPSYINCVAELESNDEGLMCADSDSKVIFHKTYTCILYIHTHAHIIHIYIVHTLYIHMYIKKLMQREKFN